MYKSFGLVLLSALAAVGAKKIDINAPFDQVIEQLNNRLRQIGTTIAPIPEIPLDSKVKYSGAQLLGLDSFKRTADCWEEVKDNEILIDLSYGYELMTIVLPHLEINGTNMSAYATVRDNSVHLSYTATVVKEQCHIKLNELKVEKLENIEFGASRPEYDGSNLDGFFKSVVVPALNGIVDSNFEKIETSLQALCNVKDYKNLEHVNELMMSIV
ncbi:uncharacterized protein [Halyomorpha halys]|uniref:uncharacterized protein n=1 Tax=Halyomorpha halys TaxID=286706 RepID=UPI0006D4E765|nr:uncharacterized protein LOC106683285 [Halyomorpha halys]